MSNKTKKNRIKNLRNITVNGKQYKWLYSNHNCDGDWGCILKIWRIWENTRTCILDEYIDDITANRITPKIVRDRILKQKTH